MMSNTAKKVAELLDMLPEQDQSLAYELVKKMVLAWDPDFTKVTPEERAALQRADGEFAQGDFVRHEEIDWD